MQTEQVLIMALMGLLAALGSALLGPVFQSSEQKTFYKMLYEMRWSCGADPHLLHSDTFKKRNVPQLDSQADLQKGASHRRL